MDPQKNQLPQSAEDYLVNKADKPTESRPVQSPITQKAFDKRPAMFNPLGKIEDINADEVKVADIRRHFFGLFLIYLGTVIGLGLAVGLVIFLLPSVVGTDNAAANSGVLLLAFIVAVFGLIFLVLATKIYNANQLMITDKNVTQVLQVGLFRRKVSELTMNKIEDVTADQRGIFPTLFNYGTLTVETAGEQNNFIFKYCPNPNAYAKALQDCRSAYHERHFGGQLPSNA